MLCPYLSLAQPVEFAGWWIGPINQYEGLWSSERLGMLANRFAGAFVDVFEQPVAKPSLLARAHDGIDGTLPNARERMALQAALDLAFLASNPVWRADEINEGWRALTSDNTSLFIQPIDTSEGWIALGRGLMVEVTSGGHRIDESLKVRPPLELNIPHNVTGDDELLDAAYRVFVGERDYTNADLAARMREATTWLAKAWRNSPSISWEDRVVF